MKHLICIPFANEQKMNSGVNLSRNAERLRVYLENATVALCSAKYYNPECDVIFATNMTNNMIPQDIYTALSKAGVIIRNIPFDRYRFSNGYTWALAFYKLCVLSHLVEEEWDCIAYLDTDVYIQGSFKAVWKECHKNILLYDINHGLNTKEYNAINQEFIDFTGKNLNPTHFGGEFFAANKENASQFETICMQIYQNMYQQKFITTKGDEFIVSLAALELKKKIKNASPYIHRFWTGLSFRLVSTSYKYNPVIVLHMPAEKEKGFVKLYKKFISKGKIPKNTQVWKMCRLLPLPLYLRIAISLRDCIHTEK